MFKHMLICTTLVVLGTIPLGAQQQEAVLRQIELPGVGFNIVLAMSKSPAERIDLDESPDALVAHLAGGELALAFEDGRKMLEAVDALRHPACAFRTAGRNGESAKPVAVYIVPAQQPSASIRTASLDVQLRPRGIRKVEVPGNSFDIVYTTTETPIAWDAHERPDPVAVYSAGSELIMATDSDIERMFRDVGLSQWPTCAFYVERKGSSPSQAASVYIVPTSNPSGSLPR